MYTLFTRYSEWDTKFMENSNKKLLYTQWIFDGDEVLTQPPSVFNYSVYTHLAAITEPCSIFKILIFLGEISECKIREGYTIAANTRTSYNKHLYTAHDTDIPYL